MLVNDLVETSHLSRRSSKEEPYEMVRKIQTECSDILGVYNSTKRFLYRGIRTNHTFFKSYPRNDRQPADNSMAFQQIIDNIFVEAGCSALRSNSTFVTSNIMSSRNFGDAYIIFPINGFEYAWTNIEDITEDEVSDMSLATFEKPFFQLSDEEKLELLDPRANVDIDQAIVSGKEIMIHGPWYAVRYTDNNMEDLNIWDLKKIFFQKHKNP